MTTPTDPRLTTPTVVTLGVHVLDVVVRPVTAIPVGQGAELVDDIHLGPAGTAGGTAVVLARLGASVRTVGIVGDDAAGRLLVELLAGSGVDTSRVSRRRGVATSASVIPVRPDGSRPALHLVGASTLLGELVVDEAVLEGASWLHVGGPELFPDVAQATLRAARSQGLATSIDFLVPGDPAWYEVVEPLVALADVVLPNDEQVLGFTGASELVEGCRRLLDAGTATVVVTAGAAGAVVVDATNATAVPAVSVEAVDTTGCGDAFSAGFIRGRTLGLTVLESTRLGCAVAGLVATGSGTDAGCYDLAAVSALAGTALEHAG